jgi:hypothetical protein
VQRPDTQFSFGAFNAIDNPGRPKIRQSYSIADLEIPPLDAGSAGVSRAIVAGPRLSLIATLFVMRIADDLSIAHNFHAAELRGQACFLISRFGQVCGCLRSRGLGHDLGGTLRFTSQLGRALFGVALNLDARRPIFNL